MTVKTKRPKSGNRQTEAATGPSTTASQSSPSLLQNQTIGWSLLSAILIWAAFPPIGAWALAWIAPYGWLRLIAMPQLQGKRTWLEIYFFGGCVHWLLMTWWVTLPHWTAAIGWLFLSAYLAVYVMGFIALARWLVHRAGLTTILAAPLAWVTMEVVRSYLFTGFALTPLSHSQVDFVSLIQISKYTGAYGVSFLVMLFAATVEFSVREGWLVNDRKRLVPAGIVAVLVAAICVWLNPPSMDSPTDGTAAAGTASKSANVAIIQASLDTTFPGDAKEMDRAFNQYLELSRQVTSQWRASGADIDLVVWPESMFRMGIYTFEEELKNTSINSTGDTFSIWAEVNDVATAKTIRQIDTHCLVGTSSIHFKSAEGDGDRYNTAGFFGPDGSLIGAYNKMHPVMFGEYAPFGEYIPWVYNLMPIGSGLTPGKEPKAFKAGELNFAPNICFENTVPHLVRRQVCELHQSGQEVNALVTLTNDGWFWGSSLLDVHLACGVFRAVENDRPMLIAANTGISAEIDRFGRVKQKGPKRAAKVIVAQLRTASESEPLSVYTQFGDWFPLACLAICGVGLVVCGVRSGRAGRVN